MKASELQIGDYVNYRGQIIKITSLYDKGDSNEVGWSNKESVWVNADNVKPIPITPEILKKNGWFYPGNYIPWMKMGNPYRELWGCSHSDGTFWLYASGDCDKDESFAEIRYVHELQHALKLCGIDMEITL